MLQICVGLEIQSAGALSHLKVRPGLMQTGIYETGQCPGCSQPMVARCGQKNEWHWAHLRKTLLCDRWWENETEWHRNWKGNFPVAWQEFVHKAEDGERHIADVRTDHGCVIEFQHSSIEPEERRSRDAFYRKLVWVVNAGRRKTDSAQFDKAMEEGTPVGGNPNLRRVRLDKCRLLREWSGSPAPIFFDFGNESWLWWLLARRPDEPAFVSLFPRIGFIEIHHGKGPEGARDFNEFTKTIGELVAKYNAHLRAPAIAQTTMQTTGFRQYLPRTSVRRRL